jgi:trimeric autotransporter adhesin
MEGNPSMANATKKRIALGAAVAVFAGLLSAAPASAATTATPFSVSDAASASGNRTATTTASQIAGASNFVSLGFVKGDGYNAAFGANLSGFLTVEGSTFSSTAAANVTLSNSNTVATLTDADETTNVRVNTASVGTVTVKFITRSWSAGVATDTTRQTVTVTVTDGAVVNVYSEAKSQVKLGDTNSIVAYDGTEPTLAAKTAAALATTAKANVTVYQRDANGTALTSGFKSVSFSITGAGSLGTSATQSTGTFVTPTAAASNTIYVFSDGRSGVATITATVNGAVLATKSVTFYGAPATVTVTNNVPHIVDTVASNAGVFSVVVTDANGVAVPSETVTFTSSATDVIANGGFAIQGGGSAVGTDGKASINVTPVGSKFGSVTLTVEASNGVKGTGTVVVTDDVIASITLTLNKATYSPGEQATATLTAKDANGVLLGKSTVTALAAAAVSSVAVQGDMFNTSVDFAAGTATVSFFMPLVAGPVTISAKTSTNAKLATSVQGATLSATASVVLPVNVDLEAAKAASAKAVAEVAKVQEQITLLAASVAALVASLSSQVRALSKQLTALSKAVAKLRR